MDSRNKNDLIIEYKKTSQECSKRRKRRNRRKSNIKKYVNSCMEFYMELIEDEPQECEKVELKRVSKNVLKRVYNE